MTDWIPMFTLPNITLTQPIETHGVALASTADPRLAEISLAHPAFQSYVDGFKTEFGRSLAPSFVLVQKDAPPAFRGVEALAAFRDSVSMSVIPLSWAKSLRFGPGNAGIHYSNWFSIYPWMLDKNYEYLLSMTMATTAMDEVGRLRGQSSPGISARHLDHHYVDRVLLDELLTRWQRCYRAETPEHADVALFRSLNMANSAALMPAGVEATMYDIGRSVSLWVSAFEILSPAKSSAEKPAGRNRRVDCLHSFRCRIDRRKQFVVARKLIGWSKPRDDLILSDDRRNTGTLGTVTELAGGGVAGAGLARGGITAARLFYHPSRGLSDGHFLRRRMRQVLEELPDSTKAIRSKIALPKSAWK
jgi:hypothetical protein